MEKAYNAGEVEEKIYNNWEKKGYFKPEVNPQGKPYCIILPPPNANGDLHFGHAMFVIEDILIRYHRMKGCQALWLPGTDHAGTETQFVFEKKLQEQGKSRFDYSREELYKMIWDYVQENRGGIDKQLRKLGFSLDWSRSKFTLDEDIVKIVKQTFRKMYEDQLVYRDYRLVNYCTRDGTSFSDLEVVNKETEGSLYYIKFPLKNGGFVTVATTRPETFLGDVAVMVNPKDKRYKDLVGQTVVLPFIEREIPIVADEYVKMEFGTGAVKVTPAHDFNDFEIARKHKLTFPPIIGFDGKMQNTKGILDGLYVKQARTEIVNKLEGAGFIEKIAPHKMVIPTCYKCKTVLEPLPLEQWYVKVQPLISNAIKSLDNKFTKIYPANFTPILKSWYAGLRDWNISRQNVWGIQIPVWYNTTGHEAEFNVSFIDKKGVSQSGSLDEVLEKGHSMEEILKGLQKVNAPITSEVVFEDEKKENGRYLPETDTFDTWFSSGQWPYVTLKTTKLGDFEKFYPTSVMETGYDILKAWISRMLMLGLYVANGQHVEDLGKIKDTVPFKDVVLHGLVNDPLGKKMSKSKGNVVNPLEVVDQYGADSVRLALVYGTALGNDQAMSYTKLDASKKFANKLWNMARFIEMAEKDTNQIFEVTDSLAELKNSIKDSVNLDWIEKTEDLSQEITAYLDKYQFNLAAERLYDFIWHDLADKYIEIVKKDSLNREGWIVLKTVYLTSLKLLHPFMPFVTEEIFQTFLGREKSIMIEKWPTVVS
ncbi:MAG TPA: valine--tRNA ligase [Candidatus Limnocylindrales bacterium]|nr:valine--tRNA ligase [Candidatus Limnocylindrales bacterium]